jgi:hypothetical protein
MSFGVVYVVNSEYFIPRVTHSIRSLRKVSDHPVTVCCKDEHLSELSKEGVNLVSLPENYLSPPADAKLYEKPNWHFYCKFFSFRLMPYEINIHLDADTEVLRDPALAYDSNYDISLARECHCDWLNKRFIKMQKCFNSGVAVYKRTPIMESFFREAENDFVYENINPYHSDQTSINRMIREKFRHQISVNTLDRRWNVRVPIWNSIKDPYLLHSHNLFNKKRLNKIIEKWS